MTGSIADEVFIALAKIVTEMADSGLPPAFCRGILLLARENEGVADLVQFWKTAPVEERDAIVADLEELLEDSEVANGPMKRPRLSFNDLPNVIDAVKAHKIRLRELIDRHGGVSEVARKSGIPQPSLSRMLNSASMPRRTTLYKIAMALGVSEAEIIGEWAV